MKFTRILMVMTCINLFIFGLSANSYSEIYDVKFSRYNFNLYLSGNGSININADNLVISYGNDWIVDKTGDSRYSIKYVNWKEHELIVDLLNNTVTKIDNFNGSKTVVDGVSMNYNKEFNFYSIRISDLTARIDTDDKTVSLILGGEVIKSPGSYSVADMGYGIYRLRDNIWQSKGFYFEIDTSDRTIRRVDGDIADTSNLIKNAGKLLVASRSNQVTNKLKTDRKCSDSDFNFGFVKNHTLNINTDIAITDKYIVTSGFDSTIKLWNRSDGLVAHTLNGHSRVINKIAVTTNSKYILSSSMDNKLILWDIDSARIINETTIDKNTTIYAVACSADINYAYAGDDKGNLYTINIPSLKIVEKRSTINATISDITLSPDGKYLVAAYSANCLMAWRLADMTLYKEFWGHLDNVNVATFTDDGKYILSGGIDGSLMLWDLNRGLKVDEFKGVGEQITSVSYIAKHGYALATSPSNSVFSWDINNGTSFSEIARFRSGAMGRITYDSKSDKAYFVQKSDVYEIDFAKKTVTKFSSYENGSVIATSTESSAKYILVSHDNGTTNMWDNSRNRLLWSIQTTSIPLDNKIFSDGQRCAVSYVDGSVMFYDIKTGNQLSKIQANTNRILSIDISPNGKILSTGSYDNNAVLYEVGTGNVLVKLKHGYPVDQIRISNDNNTVTTVTRDRSCFIWDIATGQMLRSYKASGNPVIDNDGNVYYTEGRNLMRHNMPSGKTGILYTDKKINDTYKMQISGTLAIFTNTNHNINDKFASYNYIIDYKNKNSWELIDYTRNIDSLNITKSGEHLYSMCNNGDIDLYHADGKGKYKSLQFINKGKWVVSVNGKGYNASKDGKKYVNIYYGDEVINKSDANCDFVLN